MTVWSQNPFDNLPHEGFRKQRYWLMAEAFVRAGHRVVYWTSDFSHAAKRGRILSEDPSSAGIELRLVPTRPYHRNVGLARVRSHRDYAREWQRLCADAGRPDVVVSSFPTIAAAEAALRIGHRAGAKVVIDVQDAWPETFERLVPRPFRALACLVLLPLRSKARRIFREADVVTGVCDRYRDLVGRDDYYRAYLGIER